MVLSGDSGLSSWRKEPESPTSSIASRTPCSSLTSMCTQRIPKLASYMAMAASRSATAMPTWSIWVTFTGLLGQGMDAARIVAVLLTRP